jgi:inorganic pyrophosphatase
MCHVVGALKLEQREAGKSFRNDRFIAIPDGDIAHADIGNARDLTRDLRGEIEAFLRASVSLTGKKLAFRGWADRRTAMKMLKRCGTGSP